MLAIRNLLILAFSFFLAEPISLAQVPAPVITVNGTVATNQMQVIAPANVTISAGSSTRIYYTLDGSVPSFASTRYSSPLDFTTSFRIQAIAYDENFNPSPITDISLEIVPGFHLDVIPSASSLEVTPLLTLYPSNTVATLHISSLNFWRFVKWSGDVDETDTNLTIQVTMDRNKKVKVILETDLFLKAVGGGKVYSDHDSPIILGTFVKLTAIPDPGFYFVGWDGLDNGSTNASPTFHQVIRPNRTVTALFAPLPANFHALNLTSEGPGAFYVSPAGRYFTNNTQVSISVQPRPGAVFGRWTGGVQSTNAPTITVTMDSTKEISAEFEDMVKWVLPLPAYPVPLAGIPTIAPDGTIYLCSNSNLVAISQSPAVKWQRSLPFYQENWPVVGDDGSIYVTGRNGGAVAYLPKGDLLWQYQYTTGSDEEIASESSPSALAADNTLYNLIGLNGGQLLAIKNGNLLWSLPLPVIARLSNMAVNSDGTIYLASPRDSKTLIHAISPAGVIINTFTNTTGNIFPRFSISREQNLMVVSQADIFLFDPNLQLKNALTTSGGFAEAIFTSGLDTIQLQQNQFGTYRVSLLDKNFQFQWTNILTSDSTGQSIMATSSGDTLAVSKGYGIQVLGEFTPAQILAISSSGQTKTWMPTLTTTIYRPVLDTDGDLFVASHERAWGQDPGANLVAFRTPYIPADSGWPMFGANAQHTYRLSSPKPVLSISSGTPGQITISANPPSGTTYSLDLSTNLVSWDSIATYQGPFTTNLPTAAASEFYRLKQTP